MVLNFLDIHILICAPVCGKERETKIREITWDEPHTLLRVILQCPCSVLDYRTVTVISDLQITSWLHCSQKHFLLQRDPVHWLPQARSNIAADIPQNSLYVRSDFQFSQAYWDFYCSGFWFRALRHRLFIMYLAYFFCQIKSISIIQSSTTVVWGELCLGIPDRWWGTKSHITYEKQTSHIQVCWRFSSQKRSHLAFFFSQVQ